MDRALMVGVGGTGGRVLSQFGRSTLCGEIYIDAFDERGPWNQNPIDMLTLSPYSPGPGSRIAAKKALASLRQELVARLSYFRDSLSPPESVIIVASLAGGIGGGIFLDVANQCREILGATNVDGYLCMPSLLPDPVYQSFQVNTSLALAELRQAQLGTRSAPPFDSIYIISNDSGDQASNPDLWIADYIRGNFGERKSHLYEPPSSVVTQEIISDLQFVNRELLSFIRRHPQVMYELSPRKFEDLIAEILRGLGYEITLTKQSRDGGKDLYAVYHSRLGSHLYIVECKRYAPSRPVGVDVVRSLYGVVQQERATMGVVATTSSFTKDAEQFQSVVKFGLSLKGYNDLSKWIDEYFNQASA
jgi:hypothetical protein